MLHHHVHALMQFGLFIILSFLAACSCGNSYSNVDGNILYYNGKCYALRGTINNCPQQKLWQDAQNSCVNDIGSGNAGRLATFATCAEYTAVKNGIIASNGGCGLWIGMENANTAPIWADPQGACSSQPFNSTGNWGSSCDGNQLDPGGGGNPLIYITSNWGNWNGESTDDAHGTFLCEFGKACFCQIFILEQLHQWKLDNFITLQYNYFPHYQ